MATLEKLETQATRLCGITHGTQGEKLRVLVTGAAGFIGANLCRTLINSDWCGSVVGLDDLSTGSVQNLDGVDVELVEGTILDTELLADSLARVDRVIHLAAIPSVPRSIVEPMKSHQANATGTLNVLEAARTRGTHVVVASSSSVYGATPGMPKNPDMATRPMSPYAVSKLATEGYAIAYGHSYNLPTLAFRFFNVYGPLQPAGHAYAAVIPAFVDAALKREALPVNGDGQQSRDFTFVDTVTEVLSQASRHKVASPIPVNLALGTNTSLLELIDLLKVQLGYPLEIDHRPERVGDVKASQADSSLLRELFPDIRPKPLEEGLAATVDWFRSQKTVAI